MRFFRNLLLTLMAVPLVTLGLHSQKFDLRFVQVANNGTNVDMLVQIKADTAAFRLGGANLVFVDSGDVSTPVLLSAANFSGGSYGAMTLTTPALHKVSLNIDYLAAPGSGTEVTSTYIDVATVRFTTTNPSGSANFRWNTQIPNRTNVFMDDQATEVAPDTLASFMEGVLPIQLISFTASVVQLPAGNGVRLAWATASEVSNFGFFVQRRSTSSQTFSDLPNSFQPGHLTTNQRHDYSFVDSTAMSGSWFYRLRQVDLDNSIHYSEEIQLSVTGVAEAKRLPTEFGLDQNYPNPFNPSTIIQFALPRESRVKLEVFNLLGQRVAVLEDGVMPAGYHSVTFRATNLSSGLYFYRLNADAVSFLKKMMIVK